MDLEQSRKYIEEITRFFPLLDLVSKKLKETGALQDIRLGWHCHLTEQTAVAVKAATDAGARVLLSECNPATTSDGAKSIMESYGARVFCGPNAIADLLSFEPQVLSDTGLVLIENYLRAQKVGEIGSVLAAQEITTSGIATLDRLIDEGVKLAIPLLDINAGLLKERIENYHAVGQGVVEGLARLIGRSMTGACALVVGYGAVGSGVAHYLRRDGLNTTVCEGDPVRRLIAHYDGFATFGSLDHSVPQLAHFDLIVTATGKRGLLGGNHWATMKDGVVVANVGHWREELDLEALAKLSKGHVRLNEHLERFVLSDSGQASERKIYVLTDGDPVNVVLLTGSPEPTLIHLSTELLALGFLSQNAHLLKPGKQSLPGSIEREVARLCLHAIGKADLKRGCD